MKKKSGALALAFVLLCWLPLPAQKKAAPKTIRFQGAAQYTPQELLAAAGLKPETRLSLSEVKAHGKMLSDTGLFKEVKFTNDNKGLLFTLTPSTQLFPMHLENVPLAPGKELDAKLHDRFPLYRGQLPSGGSMVDGICQAFGEMLAAKGAKATVKAALTSGIGPQKLTAMNFSVTSPSAVHIGPIQFAGVSAAMQAKASLLAGSQTGNGFDTDNSAKGLQRVFEDLYQDQGYAAVEVNVAEADPLTVADSAVEVPYTVTIKEGGIYKLGTIDYPPTALVSRAEIEKMLPKNSAAAGRPLDLFVLAVCDAHHHRGYLDCSVVSHPSFNETTHIVNYSLEVAPGPQYRLASVKFDGAPEVMAAKLKLVWKMAPGDVFDEGYVSNFAVLAQKKDKSLTRWMQSVLTTYDVKTDPATHQVNATFHFAKAVQAAH